LSSASSRRKLRSLWSAEGDPLIFFVTAFLVGISINLASNRIEDFLKQEKIPQLSTAIALGVVGIVLFAILVERWKARTQVVYTHLQPAQKAKWLIALASTGKGIATAEAAIRYHHSALEKIWLICSTGGEISSEAEAENLKQKFEQERILQPDQIQIVRLKNSQFEDPEAVKSEIEKIYEALPYDLSEKDVIIDITGGRKATTAGAFLAGLPEGRRIEIINPLEVDETGHGTKPGDPVEIVVDYSLKRVRPR